MLLRQETIQFYVRRYLGIGLATVILFSFCANFAGAAPVKVSYKYQEIKAISKNLKKSKDSDDFEKLVEKARAFINEYPQYKRVDEVYYILGNALVQQQRTEEGILIFEALIQTYPAARYVEISLLKLGLAYDKLGKHDKADDAYKKLVNHPKYGSRAQAKIARQLLERDRSERNGELNSSPANSFIGKPAPDFEVIGLNGEKLSLEKYRGQVVLLDFWATWCAPCIAEMPHVKKTYQKYKDQDFEIISISLDQAVQPLEEYIKKEGLAWPQFLDDGRKISKLYNVSAIPSTFLINGDGVVRKTNLRGSALETAVAELVKENLAKQVEKKAATDSQAPQ